MKIDKKNPKHILILAMSVITSYFAIVLRALLGSKKQANKQKSVIFYGHTLNGNLLVMYNALNKDLGYKAYFLSLDKAYLRRLEADGQPLDNLLWGDSFRDMAKVARADAFITSHGLHLFTLLRKYTDIKFVDVFHASAAWKGFDKEDFRHLHDHDETWVSSEYNREMYVNRYGFRASQVKVTGSARMDQLINGSLNKKQLLKKYRIPTAKKYVLIAPTWAQDSSGRNILPFGTQKEEFFSELDKIAKDNDTYIIFRAHLNSSEEMGIGGLSNTLFMPYSEYERAEEFLYIADILVSDWSSITFDYLPLNKPTIFFDVPAPFKKGFSIDSKYRFGEIVKSFSEFKTALDRYLKNPASYSPKYDKKIKSTKRMIFGNTLDKKSVERCLTQLQRLLS